MKWMVAVSVTGEAVDILPWSPERAGNPSLPCQIPDDWDAHNVMLVRAATQEGAMCEAVLRWEKLQDILGGSN